MISENPSWDSGRQATQYPSLKSNHTTEVLVIGGGMCGILTTRLLAQSGKQVTLIDKDRLGNGATGATTAHITQVIDTAIPDLITSFGNQSAKAIWESGQQAINLYEQIIRQQHISCEFTRCTGYRYTQNQQQLSELISESQALQNWHVPTTLVTNVNTDLGFSTFGYLKYPHQAMFHPFKFIDSLAHKLVKQGTQIFENTQAIDISSDRPFKITTNHGTITSTDVIIATHIPFNNPPQLFAKKAKYVSYALEVHIPSDIIPSGLYWDLNLPYYYFRVDPQSKYDRVIIGGQDHRHELPLIKAKAFNKIKNYLKNIVPSKTKYDLKNQWYGPIIESSDGLPFIGQLPNQQYLATAFSGNGMTYSAIAAIIFHDLITGKKNPWSSLYNPTRPLSFSALYKKIPYYSNIFLHGYLKTLFS